jgi:hypothetical protein
MLRIAELLVQLGLFVKQLVVESEELFYSSVSLFLCLVLCHVCGHRDAGYVVNLPAVNTSLPSASSGMVGKRMAKVLSLPAPKTNTITLRSRSDGPTLLELSDEHVQFNDPSGKPLLEARADGSVFVRGQEMERQVDPIYDSFTEWMKKTIEALYVPKEYLAPQPTSYGQSTVQKLFKTVLYHDILKKVTEDGQRKDEDMRREAREFNRRRMEELAEGQKER